MTATAPLQTLPADPSTASLSGRLVVVIKEDCPTCQLVLEVLQEILSEGKDLTVVCQDDPAFPKLEPGEGDYQYRHDGSLEQSHALATQVVPTLYRIGDGQVEATAIGWNQQQWRALTGLPQLGSDLPPSRPGCGALNLDPKHLDRLEAATRKFGSRLIELGDDEDPTEALFARGLTDGLPVVPPTPERVNRMLRGTDRDPSEVVGTIAPDYIECTVEKVAINAVMAGCRPEYLPVVITAVEAACDPAFNWHGLAATTFFSGPVMVVSGPVVEKLGLNTGINALGQGHRANLTIGRALNLTLRNVGGARPGEIDRATLGNPGKLSFCIAENEDDSPWPSLACSRGIKEGVSALTLFAGEGPRGIVDQLSRDPDSLAQSFAWTLRTVGHPKLILGFDAILVVSPEHARIFREAGWSREQLTAKLHKLLSFPPAELIRGANGCAEGVPESLATVDALPKFKPDALLIIHTGGQAGLFSAVIGGWVNGEIGSTPVTREIR